MNMNRLRQGIARAFTIAGAITAAASVWVTYDGLFAQSGNATFSALLATVAGVISFLVLHVTCQVLPKVEGLARVWVLLGVLLGFVAMGATSTTMAVSGMAAPEAQRLEMRDTLDQAARRLEALQIQAKSQKKAAPLVEAQAERLILSAQQERSGKVGTQVKKGKHSRSAQDLEDLALAYQDSAQDLRADDGRRLEAAQEASQTLATLQALVDGTRANAADLRGMQQSYFERLRQLNLELSDLQTSLLDEQPLAGPAQFLASRRQLPMPMKRGPNRSNAEDLTPQQRRAERRRQSGKQQEEQAALAAMHERQQVRLDELAGQLGALRSQTKAPPPFERLSPLEAVYRHRRWVSHLIAFPIALDFAVPTLAILFLSLLRTRPSNAPSPVNDRLPPTIAHATPTSRHLLAQHMASGRGAYPGARPGSERTSPR